MLVSLDRVPAPLAFAIMAICGALETLALFRRDTETTSPWYVQSAPFVAFGLTVLVGLVLVITSRSAVVHRETGTLWERCVAHALHLGRVVTLHAIIATILVVPALVMTNKFVTPTSPDAMAKPSESTPAPATTPAPSASSPNATPSAEPASSSMPEATTSVAPPTAQPPSQPPPAPTPSAAPSGTNSNKPLGPGTLKQPDNIKAAPLKVIRDKPPPPPREIDLDGTE